MAHEYLDIVVGLKTPTQSSAIKAHLFRLCRPGLEVHKDLREHLGKSRFDDKATGEAKIATYRAFVNELQRRLELDMQDDKYAKKLDPPLPGSVSFLTPPKRAENGQVVEDKDRPSYIPHWLAQPYFRPPLIEGGAEAEKKKNKAKEEGGKADKVVEIKDVQTQGEREVEELEGVQAKPGRQRSDSEAERQAGEKRVKLDEVAA